MTKIRDLKLRIEALESLRNKRFEARTINNEELESAFFAYEEDMKSLVYEAAKNFVVAYEAVKAKQVTPKETNDD